MSSFVIQVNGPAYGTDASYRAYRFTQAALAAQQRIICVFFYLDGVLNANGLNSPATDEVNLTQAWQQLAKQHQLPLVNCASASLRRGIVSEDEALQLAIDNKLSQGNLATPFVMGGLGELVSALEQADRSVCF